jgi:enamine deaminase RidA (YjgF/YER057c/UK114 family)
MTDLRLITLAPQSSRARYASDIATTGGWSFFVGLPIDLHDDRKPVPDGLENQMAKLFANVDETLAAVKLAKTDVAMAQIALVDFERFYDRMNVVYERYFGSHKPARTCAGVTALTRGALIEIGFVLHQSSTS